MRYLVFDLETIPSEEYIESQTKQLQKKQASKPDLPEMMIRGTDPFLGKILCIGMYYKDSVSGNTAHKALFEGTEKDILEEFWDVISKLDSTTKIITFNGFNFDIPWVRIRSLVHGIQVDRKSGLNYFFNVNQFKNTPHVDLMIAVKGDKFLPNITVGLGLACDMFGIPSPKGGIDGSEVYDAFKAGKLNEIVEYVKRDVYSTGMLYERMITMGYL